MCTVINILLSEENNLLKEFYFSWTNENYLSRVFCWVSEWWYIIGWANIQS